LKQKLTDAAGLINTNSILAIADINGDGIPDISVQDIGIIAIFLGRGDGTCYAAGWRPSSLLSNQAAHDLRPASPGTWALNSLMNEARAARP
jgi:hypothetical protein